MKKYILIFFLLLSSVGIAQNSERFRRDYNYATYKEYRNGKWSDWKKYGDTSVSVIFNFNSNSDIKIYYPNKETIYRRISSKEEGKTNDGDKYQGFYVLDEEGYEYYLRLFDDGDLTIHNNNFVIQFIE